MRIFNKTILAIYFLSICLMGNLYPANDPVEYELTNISFEGSNAFSGEVLEEVISSRRTPNWLYQFLNSISESIGSKAIYYDSLKVPDDIKALKNFYKDNGYFEMKVSHSVKLFKDNKKADLVYNISEGPHFRVNSLKLTGLDLLPEEIKTKVFDLANADTSGYFSKEAVETDRQEIRGYLVDHGYMLVSMLKPDIYIDTAKNIVNSIIGFEPGQRYRIKEIRIEKKGEASQFVEDSLLKKISDIKPGHFYSLDKINSAQIRLFNTNLFSSVLVSGIIADTSGDLVPINISADIGPLIELSPEFLINNQESTLNVGVGAQYSKKNFLGNARMFSLSGNFVVQDVFKVNYANLPKFLALGDTTFLGYFDLRAKISQPFFFDKKIVSAFETYMTINKQRQYKATIYGGKISFDFEMPRYVFLNSLVLYYNLESSIHDYQPSYLKKLISSSQSGSARDSIIENTGKIRKTDFTSIFGVELGTMQTNNPLFPTNGFTLSLIVEEANSIPNIISRLAGVSRRENAQFYRIISKATYYPKVYRSDKNALGLKLRIGYAQVYAGEKNDVPLNQRFTAGGSNSVRGWNSRDLTPDYQINLDNLSGQDFISYVKNDAPVGGTFLLEGSIETRNRLIGNFGSAFFADFGNTWEGVRSFQFNKIALAVGFGFRYYSPFAPIRLDLGFKAYDPSDGKTLFQKFKGTRVIDNIEFHVGIGEAF